MKKINTYSAFLLIIAFITVQTGFSQNNPFSVKQKSAIGKTTQVVQPVPLTSLPVSNNQTNRLASQIYTYSSLPFIQPGALQSDDFSSLRYNENGMLIFAESKAGMGKQFNSRSAESALEACYSYLSDVNKAMRIENPETEFIEFDNWTDDLEMQHIKMQQVYEGLKVYGGQIILHGNDGWVNKVNGTYFPTPDLNDLVPHVAEKGALDLVIHDLQSLTLYKEFEEFEKLFLDYEGPEAELIIYHNSRDLTSEKLVWHITIRPNMLENWKYFVDAKSGEILDKYNTTCTDGPETAQAQDLNGVTQTIHTYLSNGTYYLIDASRSMYNAGQSQIPDNPVGAIWTLDAQNTNMEDLQISQLVSNNNNWSNSTAVSAHNSAGLTYEYFKNTHSRNSIDGEGGTIISIINITNENGSGMDNAFWNGKAMFYGNGDQVFMPLAGGLDVGAHEMSHGVTQHTANLEYKDQSGAINEAMSDIVGCMVDREDWQLGEDIIPSNSQYYPTGAMRDMQNPHNGGTSLGDGGYQPMHTNEMYTGDQDNGGVHINSGIINHAYYLLSESVSKNKAEKLYYRALSNYMTKSSQFIDCRLAFEQAAKDLYDDGSAEYNAVTSAFYSVGIGDESGGGEGSPPPGELPINPGQDYIMSVDVNSQDANTLYISNTVASEFLPVSQTPIKTRTSITDDGTFAVFISEDDGMNGIDLTKDPFEEGTISEEFIWDNVAISKDGSRIAAITTEIDSAIWVFDFVGQQWAKFRLYNPTFTEGVVTYNVLYADALEWDYSGEYLIYDAYNTLQNDNGEDIDYWDMGFIRVWNSSSNNWADGKIEKLFSSLPEGINIGNPSLSKNSPYIMAFDYFDNNTGDTYVLGANIETGDLAEIYQQSILGFPNYSKNDKKLVFSGISDNEEVVKQVDLKNDKITPVAGPSPLIGMAKWPVWFAQGQRNLTDVEEVETSEFFTNSYPNPFSDKLNVSFEMENSSDYSIEVFNLYGQKVEQIEGRAQQGITNSIIDTKDLTKGTYFVRITADKKIKTEKVVKVK